MQYEKHHWTLNFIERRSLKYFQKYIIVWACLRPDSHLKIFFLEWAHWRAFSILTKLPGPSTLTHVKKIMSCCNLFLRDITSGGLVCMFLTERQAGGGGGEIGTLEHQTGGKHTPAATSIGGTQPQLTRVLQPLKTRSDIALYTTCCVCQLSHKRYMFVRAFIIHFRVVCSCVIQRTQTKICLRVPKRA